MDEAAAKLAGNLVSRMTNTLSNDPEVTARALWLYDRDLCPTLVDALQAHASKPRRPMRRTLGT